MNVTVIGLGKLGLPLACLHAQHNNVFGIDQNKSTVKAINRGENPVREPGLNELLYKVRSGGTFTAHNTFAPVRDSDISLVIVPTPSLDSGAFTNKFVVDAVRSIGKELRHTDRYHVVVICSTVMPGSTNGPIRAALEEASGRTVGTNLGLCYSPEFIALGSVIEDMKWPDMIMIGESDERAGKTYRDLAIQICNEGFTIPSVCHMTLVDAELAKIAINTFVTMKISFANTLGELCENLPGANANRVANAVGLDSRIGRKYLKPGVSFGGPCFPRDNRAFRTLARSVGVSAPLAAATDAVNVEQVERVLRFIKASGRHVVGVLGMSYKPGTPVFEESFGTKLVDELLEQGYEEIFVYDPLVGYEQAGHLFGRVWWKHGSFDCMGNDVVTVIANPDPHYSDAFPLAFQSADRQQALIIDPWGVVPEGPWDDTNVLRLGVY